MFEVYMPISPQIEQGTITVKLRALSQIARQDFDVEIEILVIYIHHLSIEKLT